MTSRADDDERLDVLDGLIYADGFRCALTLDEIWRYARRPVSRDAVGRMLREDLALSCLVIERDGFYSLGDPALIEERPQRLRRARRLQARTTAVARVLRHVPFVRGLALTGSLAADDAGDDADADLLVIVAEGRLATVFLVLAVSSRLLGRRLFCPNYYVAQGHLSVKRGSEYMARELLQARPLSGAADRLHGANPWLVDVFPNAFGEQLEVRVPGGGGRLQRMLEAPLRRRAGRALERRAARVARARLAAHYGGFGRSVPTEVGDALAAGTELRFHGSRADELALDRYARRRAEVAALLRRADTGFAPAGPAQ